MSTKRKPLLSDEQLSGVVTFHGGAKRYETEMGADEVRNIYEVARAKDAELIQQLVNALHDSQPNHHEDAHERYNDAMDAAAAAGFTPSQD